MGATWLYEHKQNHKKSSLKLLVRFWNYLIEMFLEWPFSELLLKFWSVNKHGISEWRLLALYRHKEILVNSFLKATKKKLGRAISKNQVSNQGPSWLSCFSCCKEVSIFRVNFNSLPNDKILNWSKLKAFADGKTIVNEKFKFCLGRVEKIVGKQENAGYEHFRLFLQCFQKPSVSGLLKFRIVW